MWATNWRQGKLSLDRKKILNLKDIKKPMLLFASEGDNITPPQQALDWIIKAYGSVEEIKKLNKVIIYMIHPDVGHLGIFVGSKAAKKEHMEIIKSIDIIEALTPGLYEMIIVDKGKKEGVSDYDVRFVERDIKDLMALNADKEDDERGRCGFQPGRSRFRDERLVIQHLRKPLREDVFHGNICRDHETAPSAAGEQIYLFGYDKPFHADLQDAVPGCEKQPQPGFPG